MSYSRQYLRFTLLLALALSPISCIPFSSSSNEIEGTSRDILLPTFRVAKYFEDSRTDKVRSAEQPSERALAAIEVASTLADDDIRTSSFGVVDFRLYELHLAGRLGREYYDQLRIEAIGGLLYSNLEMETNTDKEVSNNFGPLFGVQLGWEVAPRLVLYGKGTVSFALPDTEDEKLEFGVTYGLTENIHLLTGYRWWNHEEEDFSNFGIIVLRDSTVDLRMRGWVFGFEVTF